VTSFTTAIMNFSVSGTVCTHEEEIVLRDFHAGPESKPHSEFPEAAAGIVAVIVAGREADQGSI
jgi:hypothetical protein